MEPNLINISPDRKKIFQQSTSIVVKVGSSLLVEDKLGAIKKNGLHPLLRISLSYENWVKR